MSTKAECHLETTNNNGEKCNWNFEKYVKLHKDQQAILKSLTEHGYAGIDNHSKVCHLLKGIKTKQLDSIKTQIMSDAELCTDFDSCVNLFQDFIKQNHSMNSNPTCEAHIVAVSGEMKNGHNGSGLKKDSENAKVEDC